MARPKKDPSLLKNLDLRIPVTADQKRLVMDAAAVTGEDFAGWARDVLLKAARSAKKGSEASKGRRGQS
jgi:uncharacterized protein (DUF1778 family)